MAILIDVIVALMLTALVPIERCSISVPHDGPSRTHIVLLAIATGDSVRVAPPHEFGGTYERVDSTGPVTGYTFRVLESAGGIRTPRAGGEFVVVPWEYEQSCRPLRWSRAEWVKAGETVVFAGPHMRSRTTIPTYDVLGWHAPYPTGEFLKYRSTVPPAANRAEWLRAREYFDMLLILPPAGAALTPRERHEMIETAFERGNPRWTELFPGSDVLTRARAGRREQ